jgi:hypothetical protein
MNKIIGFLVMLCFSYSISFADTDKYDSEKEKRYQEYKHKDDEKIEFRKRAEREYYEPSALAHRIAKASQEHWERCKKEGVTCTNTEMGKAIKAVADMDRQDWLDSQKLKNKK